MNWGRSAAASRRAMPPCSVRSSPRSARRHPSPRRARCWPSSASEPHTCCAPPPRCPRGRGPGRSWPSSSRRGTNCLVLDEPTNHLDVPAIEQLEGGPRRLGRDTPAREPRSSTARDGPDHRVGGTRPIRRLADLDLGLRSRRRIILPNEPIRVAAFLWWHTVLRPRTGSRELPIGTAAELGAGAFLLGARPSPASFSCAGPGPTGSMRGAPACCRPTSTRSGPMRVVGLGSMTALLVRGAGRVPRRTSA